MKKLLFLLCVAVSLHAQISQGASGFSTEGVYFSDQYGNRTTTGIASAIAACASANCLVNVPPTYPVTESVPGAVNVSATVPSAATTGSNVYGVFDWRYGNYETWINPTGSTPSSNNRYAKNWVVNYYNAPTQRATNFGLLNTIQFAIDGGHNYFSNGQADKTNYLTMQSKMYAFTPGQHISRSDTVAGYSTGDKLSTSNRVYCYGGYNAIGDEGCEASDNQVFSGTTEYTGTLSGSPTTGATSVTITPTQGSGTQGAMRWLLDATSGTITAGTISAMSSPGGAVTTVTGSGTSWPVSTAAATIGTSVLPGSVTVTPNTFTIGAMANITTATPVCVYDAGSFETVIPTNVTGTTFTAVFAYPHVVSALISVGGGCGYFMNFTIDNVTNASFTGLAQTIVGTIHFPWPVVLTTSSTSAQIWVAAGGTYYSYNGRWSVTNNTYTMYPGTTVSSVQVNGGVSNTLTLLPNSVPWTLSDTVFESFYTPQHFTLGNNIIEKYYPSPGNAGSSGGAVTYLNGLWTNVDNFEAVSNNTPVTFYTPSGGIYQAPWFERVNGEWSYGHNFQYAPDSSMINSGCPILGCTGTVNFYQINNASGFDQINYDEANKRFSLTANNRATSTIFDASILILGSGQGIETNNGAFIVNSSGRAEAQNFKGHTSATLTVGANAGTGATLACATSYRCSGMSGTLTLTSGTTPSAGTIATLVTNSSYDFQPSCVISSHGTNLVTGLDWTSTGSGGGTVTVTGTVSASLPYTISYVCGN